MIQVTVSLIIPGEYNYKKAVFRSTFEVTNVISKSTLAIVLTGRNNGNQSFELFTVEFQ